MAKILLAEDEQNLQNMLQTILTEAGHTITAVEDGQAALKILEEERYDILITDIIMPKLGGIELMREIREKYPEIKLVAISGGGNYIRAGGYLQVAQLIGATCTLRKPFTPKELFDAIREVENELSTNQT